jgi:hypothetical protein
MAPKSGGRLRTATAIEIDRRIRNAGDYLGALISHEYAVEHASSAEAHDDEWEARRKFDRDLQSFLSAARTARNYLVQQCELVGQQQWLTERLAGSSFEFHGALANQDIHDHPIIVGKTFDVKHVAKVNFVRLIDGGPISLVPEPQAPQQLGNMRLTYVEADLGTSARTAYAKLKDGATRDRAIIDLAGEYIEGLRRIVRDAERSKLFTAS